MEGAGSEQPGKSAVTKGKPGADRNDRKVHRRSDPYHGDGRSPPDIERSESTEKRRERERIRRSDHPPYAIVGCNANSIKKSVYESVQLKIDLI